MQAHQDVTVQLSNADGNANVIIAKVQNALRDAKGVDVAKEWAAYAYSSESYDQLLRRAMETVNVV